MSYSWKSIDTVIENGRLHVLQQKMYTNIDGAAVPKDEHRLIPLSNLDGVAPNSVEVQGVANV